MNDIDFLTSLGWPSERASEAGQARWSGASADGISVTQATLERSGSGAVTASVSIISLAGTENLLHLETRFSDDHGVVMKANAGDPPEAIDAEDAKDLFTFLSKGLAEFKFTSMGPMRLPSRAPAAPQGF